MMSAMPVAVGCLALSTILGCTQSEDAKGVKLAGQNKLVGHLEGGCSAVAGAGECLYLGEGTNLTTLHVGNPAAPEIVSRIPIGETVRSAAVANRMLYVATPVILRIFDLTNSTNPVPRGACGLTYDAFEGNGLAVAGNLVYVADRVGLRIISASNPDAPIGLSSLGWNQSAFSQGVAVVGNMAYVLSQSRLQVIDVSNPAVPILRGGYDLDKRERGGDAGTCVCVAAKLAYLATGGGLKIVDVSDPDRPVLRGRYDTRGQAVCEALAGSLAFVALRTSELEIIDISNPAAPVFRSRCSIGGLIDSCVVLGDRAYLANIHRGLQIVDASNPDSPVIRIGY
jgi:hypothetical protein